METEEKKRKRKNISIPRSLAEDILKFIDEHPEFHLKRSVSAFVNEAARYRLIWLKRHPLTPEDGS
jgi:hypothetical protein